MGERGPVPKRSSQRRRTGKPATSARSGQAGAIVEQPPADPSWHPLAAGWYASLAASGQARWYEPSDWQQALVVAQLIHDSVNHGGRPNAAMYGRALAGMSMLLSTEADRRRLQIELSHNDADHDDDAAVTALDGYFKRLAG